MPNYRRLTYTDRCRIQDLERLDRRRREIACLLGVHQSTVYRELARAGGRRYLATVGQQRAQLQRRKCRRKAVLSSDLLQAVRGHLAQGWSPEQIAGRWRLEGRALVSHETIYRSIRRCEFCRPYLRLMGRRGAGRYLQRRLKPDWMRFIHQRPSIVASRRRFGDWERDTLYARYGKLVLVATERKSRYTVFTRLSSRDNAVVANTTKRLLRRTAAPVRTITNDNGPEFREGYQHDVPVYYCRPFSPHQRGTVENTIGLLRQYIGRKTSLDTLSDNELRAIETRLNLRPRKCLDYRTPYEVLRKKTVALAM